MPVPSGVQDEAVTKFAAACLAAMVVASAQPGPAFFVRSLNNPVERRESRSDILDTPVLPGSIMKAVALVAAIESQVIEPDTARLCRRTVTVEGKRYICSHPDLKRPLTPAEALAHSCNDFFVSLAPRLTRTAFNQLRAKLGLPPVAANANLAASFVGLDGPRITPRALLDVMARLAGADAQRPVAITEPARRVLLDGLKGAAQFGTASALGTRKISALAKTGTAPMPGGSWMGLVVALEPADRPTRGVVVVAPGAGGVDAAEIAADLLQGASKGRGQLANGTGAATATPGPLKGGAPAVAGPNAASLRMIKIGVTDRNGRVRPTDLDLEDYIARVVTGEGQPNAADAAQQALAITARTFALANLNRHRREGYDLCDSTHCQVMRPATEAAKRAAAATAGRVLVHQGQPASVFYSALCGGRSELASEVWPGAINYSSSSHEDEACEDEPGWSSEVRVDQIERALRAAGHRGERLRDLRVISRNNSGRVAQLRVEGFSPNQISGHDFRTAVGRVAGWQHMKSTAFEVRRIGSGYRFTGRGSGHGVGLCVIGAGHRAARGNGTDAILNFYFPNLRVEPYRPTLASTTATASAVAPSSPAAGADVLLALPASEEAERVRVTQLVRAVREEIAAKANVRAAPTIRVTVHPTVEAFGRATGQPWWVSGATDGANIDLLPLTILRQQGQLERTIRHEVAHVLLDGLLTGRRLWVREGAAFYFADSATEQGTPARVSCPTDDEFLRPVSAGAHRGAYARAEACFRRAVIGGRRWQDVR